MAKGQIGRLGFSFHDKLPVFKEIIDSYDNWVLSQVQYNYMDINNQAGRKGVEYAASKGLAVVVMEPLRGGKLSKEPPKSVAKIWQGTHRQMAPVEWAFQWVWNQPEISVALSGMSAFEQVKQNIEDRRALGRRHAQGYRFKGHRARQKSVWHAGAGALHRLQVLSAVPSRCRHTEDLSVLQ